MELTAVSIETETRVLERMTAVIYDRRSREISMINEFWQDESGFVVSAELVLMRMRLVLVLVPMLVLRLALASLVLALVLV